MSRPQYSRSLQNYGTTSTNQNNNDENEILLQGMVQQVAPNEDEILSDEKEEATSSQLSCERTRSARKGNHNNLMLFLLSLIFLCLFYLTVLCHSIHSELKFRSYDNNKSDHIDYHHNNHIRTLRKSSLSGIMVADSHSSFLPPPSTVRQ